MRATVDAPAGAADRKATGAMAGKFQLAALLPLVALTAVWSWWAAKAGGYFGTVMLPGIVALGATLAMLAWIAPWRASLRASPAVMIAGGGLVLLGGWAALSAVWSPAPDIAITDGQRILGYAVAFGLGIWLCHLLGPRVHLALVPLTAAAAFAGAITVGGMIIGDDPRRYFEGDGTLQFPLGYRNANAAFFFIALWPALGLAARREGHWLPRAAALATATLCLDLGLASQSRGSVLAGAVAVCVYLGFSRDRARRFVWVALAALPAATTIPAVSDLYQAANGPGHLHSAVGELHGVGRAALLSTGLALVIGAVAALTDRHLPAPGRRSVVANRIVGAGLVTVMLAGSIAFVTSVGDPIDWLGQRVAQFRSGQDPGASGSIRFSLNAGSSRVGLWRVALIDARDHPLLGDGGGGFRYTYLRERRANDAILQAHDAHNVALENLAEFGAPGLLMFLCAIAGAGAGVVRARRSGPDAAALGVIALSAGAYWLAHSSLDWFWPYPAVTAPVVALLGSACAPALFSSREPARGRGRLLLASGAVLLAVSTVPPFLSERYVDEAYAVRRSDTGRAYQDLDRARSLNPLSVEPLLAEGAIARANGDRKRAIDAFGEATVKRPEEWASYYYLALLHRNRAPRLARRELAAARERDPHNAQLASLARKLRGSSG